MNFIPKMNAEVLARGYQWILENIYSPKPYYERVRQFLKEYHPPQAKFVRIKLIHLSALMKSIVLLGIVGKERIHYWKLFFWSIFRRPQLFPLAITLSIYGHHFRKISEQYIDKIL
jgi:hypothetical protein